jgi:hypothetical protein
MKKSLFLLMVSVTGVLLSNSCTKESTSKDNGMIQLTITAGLPDTKTVFSEQSGENPLTVNWKSGTTESFGIFVGTLSQVPNQFTANVTSDSKSAAFTGSIPSATANGTNLIAVYPYINTSTDPAAIPFDFSSQTGNGNNLSELATKLPMVASATYTSGKNPTLSFSNKATIMKLILTIPEAVSISSISYFGKNVHNKATLNAVNGTWTYTADGLGVVKVNYASPVSVSAGGTLTAYIAVFPETSSNVTVMATSTSGKDYYYNYGTSKSKELLSGAMYTMTKSLVLNNGEFNYTGDGTASNPYLISNEMQLRNVSTCINAATSPYSNSGICYKQIADIALSGTFTPIGTSTNTFKGVYDGNSKSITGLSVN